MERDANKQIDTTDLVGLFDLLARFDYEDKKKAESEVAKGSLDTAPREPLLASEDA